MRVLYHMLAAEFLLEVLRLRTKVNASTIVQCKQLIICKTFDVACCGTCVPSIRRGYDLHSHEQASRISSGIEDEAKPGRMAPQRHGLMVQLLSRTSGAVLRELKEFWTSPASLVTPTRGRP